jgi:predicted dehydrogenase
MKRRDFIKFSAGVLAVPTLVPSRVFGKYTPNSKINIAQIGCGRMGRGDLSATMRHDMCRCVAVADVDINRARDAQKMVRDFYAKTAGGAKVADVKVYQDYRELLMDDRIDAVIISTPDHWHAQAAIEAALAGKDIYLQKPASLTIKEGRAMADAMHRTGTIFQIGSQQRSMTSDQFRWVCELVRNGAIGEIKHIQVGLGTDPGCGDEPAMPVPENLDYDMWLGSTERVEYTVKRVHPQQGYDRPGWLRCEQFGAGMITGWGAHHLDIAHWGMGTEFTGPVEVEGTAVFPKSGLWNVHGDFDIHSKYANGVTMETSSKFTNGVRFEGTDGWIFVSRGNMRVTASDPIADDPNSQAMRVSDPNILKFKVGPNGIHLYKSPEHYLNWLECIRSRKQPITPAEVAHRSCSACLLSHIAMKLPRKLYWNPEKERFINDDEANAMLSRPQRYPYGTDYI